MRAPPGGACAAGTRPHAAASNIQGRDAATAATSTPGRGYDAAVTKAAAGSGRLARMSLPAPLRTFKGHPDFWPLLALAGLLLVGAGLRGWLLAVWRPAVLGFPDEATY